MRWGRQLRFLAANPTSRYPIADRSSDGIEGLRCPPMGGHMHPHTQKRSLLRKFHSFCPARHPSYLPDGCRFCRRTGARFHPGKSMERISNPTSCLALTVNSRPETTPDTTSSVPKSLRFSTREVETTGCFDDSNDERCLLATSITLGDLEFGG